MSQTPAYAGQPTEVENPGKTLGIVALVASFFIALLGLILGIVALNQSKKAGFKNGPAKAAIILSIIFMVIGIILAIVFIVGGAALFSNVAQMCAELGPGEHVVDGVTYTCG
ncbi:hypothetical protein ACFFGH_20590 [Lysobacter korlensis]|uniref:DUF4190 domain-containing protein n=1 Tax=Lysobacter korlensis TaxID=553636 RepID=A0ABV6RTC2_9GAMM